MGPDGNCRGEKKTEQIEVRERERETRRGGKIELRSV
jgi:hypothetical protein